MTEPALTHRLILLQMRQAAALHDSLHLFIAAQHQDHLSVYRETLMAQTQSVLDSAKSRLAEAEELVGESEQEERSDADVWEETCQVVRPQA